MHVLWRREIAHSVVACPVVTSTLVITVGIEHSSVMSFGHLDAWDRTTGTHRWSFNGDSESGLERGISGEPVICGERLYFTQGAGMLRCLDVETGEQQWSCESNGAVHTEPVLASKLVFMAGDAGRLSAHDLTTGAERWSFQTDDVIRAGPAVVNGYVIVVPWDGVLHCLTLEGTVVGSTNLSPAHPTRIAANARRLALYDMDGGDVRMVAVSARPDRCADERWRVHVGKGRDIRPVLVSNRVCWVDSAEDSVTCVDIDTGVIRWERSTGRFPLPVVRTDDALIIATETGQVMVLDAQSGRQSWALSTEMRFSSPPRLADGKIFIAAGDAVIYALSAAG
jgi:outer membrane protein assembly factor BamB